MKQWSDLLDPSAPPANSPAQKAGSTHFFAFGPASAVPHPAHTPGFWLSDALKAWCTDPNARQP